MTEIGTSLEPATPGRSRRWLIAGAAVAITAVVLLAIAADGRALVRLARDIDPRSLAWPLLSTVISYSAMAASYQRIAAIAGLELPFAEMMRLTLVSTSANYLLSTGGLSGLAVRSYYFKQRHRLSSGNAVSISLAQAFITNLVLFAFFFWGLFNLLLHSDVQGVSLAAICGLFLVSATLCALAVSIVAWRGARRRLFAALMRLPQLVSRVRPSSRERLQAKLQFFEDELHEGVDFLIASGTRMVAPLLYIAIDWFLMLATLYAAFRCVGVAVPMHVVVIGFSTGVLLALVNLVPGGLGIVEGSMAAVFTSLGVPLEPAILATVIFRVSYYVLPLVVTLVFLRGMLFVPPSAALHHSSAR